MEVIRYISEYFKNNKVMTDVASLVIYLDAEIGLVKFMIRIAVPVREMTDKHWTTDMDRKQLFDVIIDHKYYRSFEIQLNLFGYV